MSDTFPSGIVSLLDHHARARPRHVAAAALEDGAWRELSYEALAVRARAMERRLFTRGARGERVAILSESRPEWAAAFFGALRAGATLVPLDVKLSREDLEAILLDCRPRLLVASARFAVAAQALRRRLEIPEDVLLLGPDALPAHAAVGGVAPPGATGAPFTGRDPRHPALIVYTSGTTGAPKGVTVSVASLDFEVSRLARAMDMGPHSVFVSMLPLSHLLEITGGLLTVLFAGGEVAYPGSLLPQDLRRAMVERRATHVITVPLFLKLLKGEMLKAVAAGPLARRAAFHTAFALARGLPARARRRLFASVHRAFGGAFAGFVPGGAPLPGDVEEFFRRLGFGVFAGYGLTETGPVIAVNTPQASRPGSVGRPLPGVEVRISSQGEIQTRGPHVTSGYYGRAEATRELIPEDGWLRTGDRGRLDGAGFLHVTGRLKNLIVLASGLKVQPEEVEEALHAGSLLMEACVIGRRVVCGLLEGPQEVCAVVVPGDVLRARHPNADALEAAARAEVHRLASRLAPFKRPTAIVIRAEPLPRTASLKVRRHLVAAALAPRGMPSAVSLRRRARRRREAVAS
jgi:long-chain acyl-CoA synthetase